MGSRRRLVRSVSPIRQQFARCSTKPWPDWRLRGVGGASISLGAFAGALSVLSPCVLPLLPLVFGAAAAAHRFGVVALVSGVAVSFTTLGLLVATIGAAVGLDDEVVRDVAASLLVLVGVILLSEGLQQRFAVV